MKKRKLNPVIHPIDDIDRLIGVGSARIKIFVDIKTKCIVGFHFIEGATGKSKNSLSRAAQKPSLKATLERLLSNYKFERSDR